MVKQLLLFGSVLLIACMSVQAAALCPNAKLYVGSNCEECVHIQQDESESIATLVDAGKLEVLNVDTAGRFAEHNLPDLQVFDPFTGALVELFQIDPVVEHSDTLLIQDSSEIPSRLRELARDAQCSNVASANPSIINQLAARIIPFPILDAFVMFLKVQIHDLVNTVL